MGLRQRGSVIGNYVTASNTSASGMWTGKEAYTLQKKGTWQLSPTFSIAAGAANVNEGASINFTMTTTGIANGTVIPYIASGANITILDSANSSLSGNFVIQNGSNTISFSANLDLTTEGNEVLQITAAGATANVTINDTSTTPVTSDAQFPYTTLLLNGQGTNNSQNNTFLDSSTNNYTLTRNGNSTQGTFSPYGGNWSNYFDGTGDVLVGPTSNTVFQLTGNGGTGLTVEAWIYPISTSGSKQIVTYYSYTDGGAEQGWYFRVIDGQLQCGNAFGGTSRIGGSIPVNTWTHVAFVINSGSFYLYVNGVSVGSVTGVGSQNYSSTTLVIGGLKQNGTNTNQVFNGYISNLRTTNTAAYTGAFTPSTSPLTAIAGTSLLTCQDNRFIDESPNNFTITKTGDVSVQKFNPFSPVITTPTTYSGYFDGTGDYLQTPASSLTALIGTASLTTSSVFTIECWIYQTQRQTGAIPVLIGDMTPTFYTNYWSFGPNDVGLPALYWYDGNGKTATGNTTIPLNTWTHIAIVINASNIKMFVNGTLQSLTGTTTLTSTAGSNGYLAIAQYDNGDTDSGFYGYISNLRIVKSAVYSTSFTPSTTPLTAISNTSLLTCQSPTFIDNSTNNFTITAFGNSQPTTVNPFGVTNTSSEYSTTTFGGSGYFDGSGDYLGLSSAASPAGLEDFTIEFWYYPLSAPSFFPTIWSNGGGYNVNTYLSIIDRHNSSPTVFRVEGASTTVVGTTVVKNNTWYHIAVTRQNVSGTYTMRLFVNGVLDGSSASASGSLSPVVTYFSRGDDASHNAGYTYINSYVSNARIVRGTAVYTSNFAPPVAPVTAVANTSMLLNFTNAGIIDNAMMTTLETVGDAKISTTQSKFGGTSMFFDGTGDYFTAPSNAAFTFGTGDFTIEGWFYVNSFGANGFIPFDNRASSSAVPFNVGVNSSGNPYLYDGATVPTGSSGITLNTWGHIAWVRTSGVLKMFVNGVSVYSAAYTVNLTGTNCTIGGGVGGLAGYFLNGYIDDFRITKGYARYTSNFTPPENQLAGK